MSRFKSKKKIDFRKIKKKIKDKKYHIILFFLCLILWGVYTHLFSVYRVYSIHYNQYYATTVLMLDSLRNSGFVESYTFFSTDWPNKIIFLRSLPLVIFDRITQVRYVSMAILTNLILLYLLFLSLEQVFKTEYAFYFILFIMSSYFFLELLISPYADLHSFFATSLFYLAAYKFIKEKKNNYVELVLTVFLMFLSRNIAYIHFPIVLSVLVVYMFISKIDYKRISYFIGCSLIGFLLFHGIAFGFSTEKLFNDMYVYGKFKNDFGYEELNSNFLDTTKVDNLVNLSTYFFQKHSHFDLFIINKFPSWFLNSFLYFAVIYDLIKKRNKFFIVLFLTNDIYNFLFFNILNGKRQFRFFLPGYFVYLFLCYNLIVYFVKKNTKKIKKLNIKRNQIFLLLILISFLFSIPSLVLNYKSISLYGLDRNDGKLIKYFDYNLFRDLPENSRICINLTNGRNAYAGNSLIDVLNINYTYSKHDSRFSYIVTSNISDADYIICDVCHFDYEVVNRYDVYFLKREPGMFNYWKKKDVDLYTDRINLTVYKT